jgi:2-oxo-4-hydroxy-4-carboxy--5-ureidoimidazoline (OHCU) decarboxylase
VKTGMQRKKNTTLNTVFKAGDQRLNTKSEDELQIAANHGKKIAKYKT